MQKIPVFYRPEQVAPFQEVSPSSAKPQYAVESWFDAALPIDVRSFSPVTQHALSLAHSRGYVRRVLNCTTGNGFGNNDPDVAQSLPYTSGSFLAAAREAIANGKVACSPTSGFHHASYDHGGGFCTFNGLMVSACALLDDGEADKIAILDLDMHYGNGTADIIRTLDMQDRVQQHTSSFGSYRMGINPEKMMGDLPGIIRKAKAWGATVLFYQAGADPHVNDPLGGYMTSEQLRRRDRYVFSVAKHEKLPIVWNLAGGYQTTPGLTEADGGAFIRPVLDIHDATMRECVAAFVGG